MNIVGLDLGSTYTGVAHATCSAKGITKVSLELKHTGESFPDKLLTVHAFAASLAGKMPDLVLAENYGYGGKFFNRDLPEIMSLYKLEMHRGRIPFLAIAPNTVKKAVTGDGRAKKPKVQKSVEQYVEDRSIDLVSDPTVDPQTRSHVFDALAVVIAAVEAAQGTPIVRDLNFVGRYYGVDLLQALGKR